MGFLDILKPKSPVEKASKQLREPFAQPDVRQGAMEKLFEIGTREAYDQVLRRFTFNAHGQIADESEKQELVERLVQAGEAVIPALEAFIQEEKKFIAFPIRAYVQSVGVERGKAFLAETLRRYEPLDHRTTVAKTSLILALSDIGTAEDVPLLVPYLDDHHDDVQSAAIQALLHLKNEAASKDALARVCAGDEHGSRVQRQAAQALVELGWSVKPHFDAFNAELKSEYLLGKKGTLIKKQVPGHEDDDD